MGPVEDALRNRAPNCLLPGGETALFRWLWTYQPMGGDLCVGIMRCVSNAGGPLGLIPGHCVSEAYDDGLLPELMSEAIEAAEALGL